jgi:hypothetical protein
LTVRISDSAFAPDDVKHQAIQEKKMFRIWFDEAPKTGADLGGSPVSKVPEGIQIDSKGEIKLDLEATERKITEAFGTPEEKAALKPVSKDTEKEEETDDTEEVEDTEDDTSDSDEDSTEEEESEEEDSDEEVVDEENLEEADSEDSETDSSEQEVPPTISKRLKDTQAAFHAERKKNRELEERLAKLEEKVTGKPDVTQDVDKGKKDEKAELTLETVDPKVLEEALKKDPINTTRWIADQQVKLSQKRAAEEQKVKDQQNEFTARYQKSEEAAAKRFPVIQKVLKMSDEQVASFKNEHPEQYEFVQKASQYWKEFNARGDVDALYNAASRAYADLSPKTLKKIREESKQLGKQEATTKTKILGKLRVESNTGTKPKSGSGFKKLTSDEFAKLSNAEQVKYMRESVDARFSQLAK